MSQNLYVYCCNEPITQSDPSGFDAIIVTDEDALGGLGHTSALFQDSNEDWYYYYWGDKNVAVEKVDDKDALKSIDKLNAWLHSKEKDKRYYGGNYTESIYVKGDFTASLEEAKFLESHYENVYGRGNDNKDYDLLTNNCSERTFRELDLGKLNDGTKVSSIIKNASNIPSDQYNLAEASLCNHAFTLDQYKSQIKAYINSQQSIINQINKTEWYQFWKPHYGESTEYYERNIERAKRLLQ